VSRERKYFHILEWVVFCAGTVLGGFSYQLARNGRIGLFQKGFYRAHQARQSGNISPFSRILDPGLF
jgi:hypothetical protein